MNNKTESIYAAPCKDLYIYYIQGHFKSSDHFEDNFVGNWQEDDFSFLFFSKPSDFEVEQALKQEPGLVLLDKYHMSYDEWQGGRFESFQAGRFFIVPPWQPVDIPGDMIPVTLDPGVVFGTGTHPTTNDCLDLLQQVCMEEELNTALDMGTGTGLLALGAAKLGCNVLALDFNLLAVKTAKRNISLNGLEHKILAIQARAEDFMDIPGDILIANIHYDVMKTLIRSKGFLTKKYFILSGLLRSQAREIDLELSKMPVEIIETRERDGVWHTFFGRRVNVDEYVKSPKSRLLTNLSC